MMPAIKITSVGCIILFVFLAGCMSPQSGLPSTPVTPVQPITSLTPAPENTPDGTVAGKTDSSAADKSSSGDVQSFRAGDVKGNFVSIAFGFGVISLAKWDEPVIKVGLSGDYRDEDVQFLNSLAQEFNSLSTTTKLQVKEGMESQPVELILLPESFVRSMRLEGHGADLVDAGADGDSRHVYLRSENPPHTPYLQKRYYISNDIPGSRNYTIKRALLDAMGFGGYSDENGSFFSATNYASTNLTSMDRAVIMLMYDLPFRQNDTIDVVGKYIH